MEKKIEQLLPLIKKERVLITKMVEADEREDILLFNALQKMYKSFSLEVDELINNNIDKENYDKAVELLSQKINGAIDQQEDSTDLVTLLGLFNTFYLNSISTSLSNVNSDVFSNELNMQIYDIYMWLMKENEYPKEFKDAIRGDLINKLVNSASMRKYFSGDYEEAEDLANTLSYYDDRNKMGTIYASLMIGQIDLSNKFEMYDGMMDDLSFNSRKKMLEIEFAAISVLLSKRKFLIPPYTMDYSDFTEKVIMDASKLVDQYNNKKTKEVEKNIIKIK